MSYTLNVFFSPKIEKSQISRFGSTLIQTSMLCGSFLILEAHLYYERMNHNRNKFGESALGSKEIIELEIGSIYQATAVEKVQNVQDGGVVTGLLGYALNEGLIKAAVVVGKDDYWDTFPVLVTESSELRKYAGSVYFPINYKDYRRTVRRAIDAYGDIGIVATPGELKVLGSGTAMVKSDEVFLKIGLFCLGSFDPEKFWSYVDNEIKRKDVKRFEIDKDLRLIDADGKVVFERPVKEAHDYSIRWCKKCPEFIPGAADLSVGAGPEKGTSAVYLQTARGLEIFSKAYENGHLLIAEVPSKFRERFERIRRQKRE
jgi:coenzyme F420 hydrogenase subunit beta